jgi:hypothetical protein
LLEIEKKYLTQLEQLAPIMDKFKVYQPRYGEKELDIMAYTKIRSPNKKNIIQISFWLTDDSRKYSGEKSIGHYLEQAEGDVAKQEWFENNLRKTFPHGDYFIGDY